MRSVRIDVFQWLMHPGDGEDDSWKPMLAVLDWLKHPTDGFLYQNVFFIQNYKFQYPLSSMLPLELLEKVGVHPSVDLLNDIGWFGILISVLAMVAYSLVLAERSGAMQRGDGAARMLVGGLAIFATLTFYPIMYAYTIGQVQVWITAAFMLACLCWALERRLTAGILIGAICLLKPQFALFVIWGMLRGQWRFVIGGCVATVPIVAFTLVHYGWDNNLDYLRVLRFLSWHGEIYYPNQSIGGLLNRMIVSGDSLDPIGFPDHNPIVYGGMLASSAVLVLSALFLRARAPDRGGLMDFLTAALTFTVASPIAWEYHYGIELPIFATLLFALCAQPEGRGRRGLWAALAVVYFFSANHFAAANATAGTPFNFVQSYLFFAGLGTLWLLYRFRTPSALSGRHAA